MSKLNSFIYFQLFLLFACLCVDSLKPGNQDVQEWRSASPELTRDSDEKSQYKSVNLNDGPKLSLVNNGALNREKRSSKYKFKTKVKVKGHGFRSIKFRSHKSKSHGHKIKIKHKTTIKIGGGTGAAFGAGLIVGGAIGAGTVLYAGRYGQASFKRNGHELMVIKSIAVANFTFNYTHGHYHNGHGEYLGSDGVYHDHVSHQVMRDAREHIPAPIVQYVETDKNREKAKVKNGQYMVPMFRYYPFNVTHGIWEYSRKSVALAIVAG